MRHAGWLSGAVLILVLGCGTNQQGVRPKTPEADSPKVPPAQAPFQAGGEWLDAQGKDITQSDVKVYVESVEVRPVKMQARVGEGKVAPTNESYLVVTLTLTNVGEKQKLEYTGWGSFASELNGNPPKLLDEQGRSHKLVTFGQDAAVDGRLNLANLVREQPKRDLVVFAAPPDDVQVVYLTLPGENIGAKEPLRLRLQIKR